MHNFIDFKKELNEGQYAAVMSPADVPALVLAGAGSGKTRTLTYRVANFVGEMGIRPQELLLLTFTNKASAQMLNRVQELTGIEAWRFWGGTFHGVGNKFLRLEGASIGLAPDFAIADAEDSEKLLKHCVEENMPKFFSGKNNPKAGLLKDILSYARNTCQDMESAMAGRFPWVETPSEQIERIANIYEARKHADNICDFDDLLFLWHKLLLENESVRVRYQERFKNVLVDEYQDTNTLQCRLLDLLCASGNISAVGDDAQCIYSWRGANIDNILNFKTRYPNGRIFKVEQNYRSTPQILNFANQILDGYEASKEFKKTLLSTREASQKPVVLRVIDNQTQARVVADTIEEFSAGPFAKYKRSDIAVLYRAHFQAMDLQLHLQYRGIPFAITSGLKFFEQAHVKDVISQMKFAANPRDFISFSRFLRFLPKIGDKTAQKIHAKAVEVSEKEACQLTEALSKKEVLAKVPEQAKPIFIPLADTLNTLFFAIKSSKGRADSGDLFAPAQAAQAPRDLVRTACADWYVNAMKTAYENWEDRTQDFDALYEYASRFSDIDEFLSSVSLEISEGEKPDSATFGERVSLMTVHQAKGLEFPVVFVIGSAEGLFPLQRCIDDGDIEEERRLFYVASTRAKDVLIITYPRISFGKGRSEMLEPSEFWHDIDSQLYQKNFETI